MSNPLIGGTSRRDLLTKAMPGCLVTCAALRGLQLMAQAAAPEAAATEAAHKFDREIPRALTYRQLAERQSDAFARAFNPQFEMVRDKTLMQGHDCCSHRYLWKA